MSKKMFAIAQQVSGAKIRSVRKELELSQAEFGRLANVSVKTVARWESGKEMISGPVVTLLKLLEENRPGSGHGGDQAADDVLVDDVFDDGTGQVRLGLEQQ